MAAALTFWTAEKSGELAELWGKLPAPEIARRIGAKSTNAVIGRAHRMGLGDVDPELVNQWRREASAARWR